MLVQVAAVQLRVRVDQRVQILQQSGGSEAVRREQADVDQVRGVARDDLGLQPVDTGVPVRLVVATVVVISIR